MKYLWDSTKYLYQRFGVDNTPIFKRQRIFMEEVLEFLQASLIPGTIKTDTLDEAADVVVTVMGCLMAQGFTYDEFAEAMSRVIVKNDSKSLETHSVDAKGKISRR